MHDLRIARGRYVSQSMGPGTRGNQLVFVPDDGGPYAEFTMPDGTTHVVAVNEAELILDEMRSLFPPKLKMAPVIQLADGAAFAFLNPEATPISIENIAHALARINRFTGHFKTLCYSTAQHSCIACDNTTGDPFDALMHDAVEAVIGDLSSPFKQLVPDYKAHEDRLQQHFADRFGFTPPDRSPSVKRVDIEALCTEQRDLLHPAHDDFLWDWVSDDDRLDEAIIPWSPRTATIEFLERYNRHRSARAPIADIEKALALTC